MSQFWWWLIEPVSRFLQHDEREALLGDLEESRQTGPRALLDVLDVVIRRQARLWMTLRPWLILFALILPVGMLLSILSRQTSDLSAIYLWMYANNWDTGLTQKPGFWSVFAETAVLIVVSYITLEYRSLNGVFVLGSLSRGISTLNSLLLCLILFFGQVIGAPDYFVLFGDKAFGAFHRPDPNAVVFAEAFYRVVLPVIVQIVLVAIPALWGFRVATDMGKPGRLVSTALWAAACATLAVVLMPQLGFWLFFATRTFHANAASGIWIAIVRGAKYLQPVEFWPIVFLIAHALTQRGLKRAKA